MTSRHKQQAIKEGVGLPLRVICSVALALAFMWPVGAVPQAALADTTDTFADAATRAGDGSEANPYQLSTEADLIAFQEAINADKHATYGTDTATYTNKYFTLAADIALTKAWVPVGMSTTYFFGGVFDGAGHTISNVTYATETGSSSAHCAFFGYVRSSVSGGDVVIKNLKVVGAGTDAADIVDNTTSTSSTVGGLVGYANPVTASSATMTAGTVTVSGCVTDVNLKGGRYVGGIVGQANKCVSITNCLVLGDIEAVDKSTSTLAAQVGGIAGGYGTADTTTTTFANNLFCGQITATDGMTSDSLKESQNALVGKIATDVVASSNNHYIAQTDTRVGAYKVGSNAATAADEGMVVKIPSSAAAAATLATTMGWSSDSLVAQNIPVNLDPLKAALKSGSTLELTSSDVTLWTVGSDETAGRTYAQTSEDAAQVSVTITTDSAGWLIFDWQFATSGNWKDKFQYASTGDTTSGSYEYIGANSTSYIGKWTTKVESINAGTTTATWTYTKGQGSTALLDEVRFVTAQTSVAAVADSNTSVTVQKSGADVTAVDPGSSVTFTATPADGYAFSGWKTSADAKEYASTAKTMSVTVYDEPATYYAYSEKMAFEGSGTAEDPYQVGSLADLQNLAKYVAAGETFKDHYIKLTSNIDASGAEFAGIGASSTKFAGTFDGDGKTISNIKLTGKGLFNYTDTTAAIKDLTVDASLTASENNVGIIAGVFAGTMTNATSKGTVASEKYYVGGLVGQLAGESTIDGCASSAAITVTYSGNTDPVAGGLVGQASYSTVIKNSSFTGSIDGGTVASGLGGVLGKSGSGTTVSGCYAAANITGKTRIGGIVGFTDAGKLTVSDCEFNGAVKGTTYVGGIIGYHYGPWSSGTSNPVVSSSMAFGTVEATEGNAGGIAGYADRNAVIENCLALQQIIDGTTTARIATKGTGTVTLSGNAAWSGTKVDDAAIAADATTAAADNVDGLSVETAALFGTETYAPASAWSSESWTVAAGKKPQLIAQGTLSGTEYPSYIQDAYAVESVIDAIKAIGDVTLESKDAIEAAETAYTALDSSLQAAVTNYADLQQARASYDALVAADEAATALAEAQTAVADATAAAETASSSKGAADEAAKTPGDAAVAAAEKAAADAATAVEKADAAVTAADAAVAAVQTAVDKATAAGADTTEAEKALADAQAAQESANAAKTAAEAAKAAADDAVTAAKEAAEAAKKAAEEEAAKKAAEEEAAKKAAEEEAASAALSKGATETVGAGVYTVLDPTAGTVAFKKAAKKSCKSVSVPATVKLSDGNSYKVVTIKKGAFKGMKKLKKVTIGANVGKVEAKAFVKVPKLKKLVVKSKLLKKKAAVKGALEGSKLKKALTVKVPKKVKKAYKKSFSKKNLKAPKAVKVK